MTLTYVTTGYAPTCGKRQTPVEDSQCPRRSLIGECNGPIGEGPICGKRSNPGSGLRPHCRWEACGGGSGKAALPVYQSYSQRERPQCLVYVVEMRPMVGLRYDHVGMGSWSTDNACLHPTESTSVEKERTL